MWVHLDISRGDFRAALDAIIGLEVTSPTWESVAGCFARPGQPGPPRFFYDLRTPRAAAHMLRFGAGTYLDLDLDPTRLQRQAGVPLLAARALLLLADALVVYAESAERTGESK